MIRELRPLLLFNYQATFPSHTCSLPPLTSTPGHRALTQATPPSRSDQNLSPSNNTVPSLHTLNMAGKSDNAENGAAPATPKAAASGGGYESLTTREQEILAKSMTCLKVAPEVRICQYSICHDHDHSAHLVSALVFHAGVCPLLTPDLC